MGAALHFDLWVPNFGLQEYMGYPAPALEVFPHAWTFHDGMMHPGEAPGHGVDIDEALAARYPRSLYIPVDDIRMMVVSGLVLPATEWSADCLLYTSDAADDRL